MSLYPFNPRKLTGMQSDAGVVIDRAHLAHYSPGALAAIDDDYFVANVAMKVGAYTIVTGHGATPNSAARNVVAFVTKVSGTLDTMGTLLVTGKNLAGATITETITPAEGAVSGVKAFASITSIVGAGWVRDAGAGSEDTVKIGYGDVVGLPDMLSHNTVLAAYLGGTKESTAPTVVVDADELEKNTFDLFGALNASAVDIYYLVG